MYSLITLAEGGRGNRKQVMSKFFEREKDKQNVLSRNWSGWSQQRATNHFWRLLKLANSNCQLCPVCLSVRPEHLGSHWTDLQEIWYLGIFGRSSDNSKLQPTSCNVSRFICFYRRSTCFRRFLRPSSGAHNCTYSYLSIFRRSADNSKLEPTRCNVSQFIDFYKRSTCFRRFLPPSSGAHNCTYSYLNIFRRSADNSKLQPRRCNVSRFIYFYRRCTCFRRFLRPSSGAHNCTYNFRYFNQYCCYLLEQLAAVLVWQYLTLYVQLCAPDDGRRNRLKHVERLYK